MEPVIEVQGLVKQFGAFTAIDNISFQVCDTEVFGILGPNGAGKTTTLEIIEGLQRPTSGSAMVLGSDSQRDSAEVKNRIGVQLQSSAYFEYLTLEEILTLFGNFYRRRVSAGELLERVGLSDRAGTTLKKLSGGQKQRFTVAASLVNDPEVVILDEPTTGLDPQARRNMWELVRQINLDGKTVVLTTHYMEEAEALCDRVAIMDEGQIVALDTPVNLLRRLDAPYTLKLVVSEPLSTQDAEQLREVSYDVATGDGLSYELKVKDAPDALARVLQWSNQQAVTLEHLELLPATLEDVFLDLTGKGLRD